ncbi:glycosyltransferase family 2 protein [Arthrobacter sp. G.S.26]|uniref:glycosyltransferase family 2 protein n=1 Tax=Arthrobacter sp. G.S.26 TaxID=3433706 RepID=UPI003D77F886
MTLTAVIVVFRNDMYQVSQLAATLVKAGKSAGYETDAILVINDASCTDELSEHEVIQGHGNVGFARGVRMGVDAASSDFIAIINPDIEPDLVQFTRMFAGMVRGRAISAPVLVDTAGRIEYETYEDWVFTIGRRAAARVCKQFLLHSEKTDLVPFTKICGAFIVLERSIALELEGPFDTDFFLYGEDRDLSRRARNRGIALKLRRDVRVIHVGGVSGSSAAELVMRAKADSALRIANRKYGKLGVLAMCVDLLAEAAIKSPVAGGAAFSARLWAIKRWLAQPGEPATLDSSILTS